MKDSQQKGLCQTRLREEDDHSAQRNKCRRQRAFLNESSIEPPQIEKRAALTSVTHALLMMRDQQTDISSLCQRKLAFVTHALLMRNEQTDVSGSRQRKLTLVTRCQLPHLNQEVLSPTEAARTWSIFDRGVHATTQPKPCSGPARRSWLWFHAARSRLFEPPGDTRRTRRSIDSFF